MKPEKPKDNREQSRYVKLDIFKKLFASAEEAFRKQQQTKKV